MKNGWKVCVAIVLLLAGVAHGELYRWVDENGRVHYSDTPPPPSVRKSDRKKLPGNTAGSQALPYELQQATKNFPVTLFVTDCGEGCTQARQLLAKRGVPHTELDATDPAAQEQLRKATGGRLEVPVVLIGRQTLRGFQPDQWNSALDAAGYPRNALVKVTPNRPQAARTPPPAPDEVEPDSDSESSLEEAGTEDGEPQ